MPEAPVSAGIGVRPTRTSDLVATSVRRTADTLGPLTSIPLNERHPLSRVPSAAWENERVQNVAEVLASMLRRHQAEATK
jgi:hypothetical protein